MPRAPYELQGGGEGMIFRFSTRYGEVLRVNRRAPVVGESCAQPESRTYEETGAEAPEHVFEKVEPQVLPSDGVVRLMLELREDFRIEDMVARSVFRLYGHPLPQCETHRDVEIHLSELERISEPRAHAEPCVGVEIQVSVELYAIGHPFVAAVAQIERVYYGRHLEATPHAATEITAQPVYQIASQVFPKAAFSPAAPRCGAVGGEAILSAGCNERVNGVGVQMVEHVVGRYYLVAHEAHLRPYVAAVGHGRMVFLHEDADAEFHHVYSASEFHFMDVTR